MSGFRWGFQWGKVGSGALMRVFLLGGRISIWGVGLICVGLVTMLLGVIGEEGVW